jgi:N-acetylneuraminic acid mutarotase
MVYDPSSNRVIAFGGGGGGVTERNDTWAYDPSANTWTKLNPSGTLPYPGAFSAMVYCPTTKRVLVFGGLFQAGAGVLNDTWAYDPSASAWSLLAPAGTLPSARAQQSMVYDPTTGQVIMFGGTGDIGALNDTWTYDPVANTWAELKPAGTVPSRRAAVAMAYDPIMRRLVLFGGLDETNSNLNDTWAFSP